MIVNPEDFGHYGETSVNYDSTRVPVGLGVIVKCLASYGKGTDEMRVLDIGCGTGAYEVGLAEKVNEIHGIEIVDGMLIHARQKTLGLRNVKLYLGDAISLPFDDSQFDAAMFNNSLHHIGNLEIQQNALHESYRVLRNGGVLIIQTPSLGQLRQGYWWASLIPDAVDKFASRVTPIPKLIKALKHLGFEYKRRIVPYTEVIQGKDYLDVDGIFRQEWRDGDSIWQLVTEEELKNAQKRVTDMKKDGTLEEYVKHRESLRSKIGQTTFLWATKPKEVIR